MATRLAGAYGRRQQTLRDATGEQLGALWDVTGQSDDDVAAFIAAAVGLDDAVRAAAVAQTEAYLAALIAAQTASSPRLLGLDPNAYMRPAPVEQVWARPFVAARTARSQGHSWADALSAGRARAVQLGVTNVQLAARGAARDFLSREPRVIGYRRVLGPGKNCNLCVVASTHRYGKADLMPIHPSCGCTVAPIVGAADPGPQAIDVDDLPDVEVVDHGELGPVLWDRRHSFASL